MEEDNVSFVDAMRCVHEYPVLLDDVWLFNLTGAYEWDLWILECGNWKEKAGDWKIYDIYLCTTGSNLLLYMKV